jgi:hypothetical protein
MNRKPIEWEGISSYISDRGVLVRVSIAANKHHDHGNAYKEQRLIGLQVLKFSLLPS